jgi:hypothetical protein
MPALLWIGMLIESGAVEIGEPVRIVGEVPRHPVEQHRKPGLMAGIDQRGKVGRRAEAARRREHAGRLIAPRAVERMLAHRQELDMGKAEIAGVSRQLVRQLAIA